MSSMTMNPREKDFLAKKESHDSFPKITPSSRQWSTHRNPRIVRVSRAFGGKDRHSKVCTVRGLRDRRIRLSVPTAIQLYDLQDRLGLSQPSKVVDWLIDATKDDIDKLPPLPMLPSNFTQPNTSLLEYSNPLSSLSHFLSTNNSSTTTHPFAKDLGGNNATKEGKEKWIAPHDQEQENQEGFGGFVAQLSAQNLFPLGNQPSSFANLPYNSYFHWDPPSLSLSQFGGGYPFANQAEVDNSNPNSLSTNSVLPSTSQLYFCPSTIPTFPSYMSPSMDGNEWTRQVNHLQQNPHLPTTLHLISSPLKPNVNSKPFNERAEKN